MVKEQNVIVLKFADSKIPVFKETKNKDWILYGKDNSYPAYLTYLFDKSAKHNAILTGKANYIFGEGFPNGDIPVNRLDETLNDISKKAILDIEIYGGFRLEVIWNALGRVCEIYHIDYSTIRKAKEDKKGFYWKEAWTTLKSDCTCEWRENTNEEEVFIKGFNPADPVGNQIYAYDEYRPMVRFYPLPSYIGCNNYIETDIEISKYYLSSIRNGLMPSKMIQFYNGDPGEEGKDNIEQGIANKFGGSEKAGKFFLVFNKGREQEVTINDLTASDMDKMFVELNKTCQQEIYAGHLITSPLLFGIKTEGQLGGNTELITAYSIFQNTYAGPKAKAYDREINYLTDYSNFDGEYELLPTDPIGIQFDPKDVINSLPKAFVFEKMGIPKEMWALENIGSDNRPTPTLPVAPSTTLDSDVQVNETLSHLNAKQLQHINRTVRQYKKGLMAEPMARTLLGAGYGLTDEQINNFLGITAPAKMSAQDEDDYVIGMFDACGESKSDYEIIKSKTVSFSSDLEIDADEEVWKGQAFKTYDVTLTEERILELIRKDKRITPEVIANTIGQSVAYVNSRIDDLTKRGYLESTTETVGIDEIIERIVPEAVQIAAPPPIAGTTNPTQIFIKYSYEGPQDSRNRPFCAKLMQLNRFYSRADIESISQRLGYSVFDRRGGFWTRKGTNITTPYCRHKWKSNIIVKRK